MNRHKHSPAFHPEEEALKKAGLFLTPQNVSEWIISNLTLNY